MKQLLLTIIAAGALGGCVSQQLPGKQVDWRAGNDQIPNRSIPTALICDACNL